MPLPPYIKVQNNFVLLFVKVQPRASRDEISGALGGEMKIKVRAPPVDSAANEALIRFLARQLDLPRTAVQIIRGTMSRHKTITLRGRAAEEVARKLASALPR
jgi:uncharacterized protein (TIGR00251 family)